MRPETRYARSGKVNIAYQVTGSGPVDLVWAPGTVSHLDLDWEWPPKARFLERLGKFCRLLRFDKRGTGLSDRPTTAATLEERVDDIRAVMDAAGSQQAVLFGVSEGGSMASVFAAANPARTLGLLLWGVQARWTRTADYPWGLTKEQQQQEIEKLEREGVTLAYITGAGAGAGPNAEPGFLDWYLRYGRAAASPAAVAALETMNAEIDTRDILPTIRVPALVMNRSGDPVAHVEAARDLASRIPGARFREWPGATHGMWDLADELVPAIEAFVSGLSASKPSDRLLATILFVDVVESTQGIASFGDAVWREKIARASEVSRVAVERFRGRWVKGTGDGLLAVFDGPTRAIQCSKEVRAEFLRLGLTTRLGLHTGECEILGADVSGIAVHLAARIQAAAKPGEILASSTVKDLVAGSSVELEDRGLMPLKGFSEERRVYAVR